MKEQIKSIEKGWGEGSTLFSSQPKFKDYPVFVDEIKEEVKQVGTDTQITVYRCYKDGKKIVEIEANSSLTICYYE